MRLVGNHGKALALRGGQLLHGLEGEWEGLDGAHHNLLAAAQCLGQLAALAARVTLDGGHHALGALEVEDGLLQLRIEHVAVADHQHAVEQLMVLRIVQVGQKVRRPGNRIGLAAARAVLDQVFMPCPLGQHGGLQLARGIELVVAREDEARHLLLAVALGDEVAAHDLQPAVALPHLLPQVGRAVACGVGRVARTAVIALVEGQKARGGALQARGHHHCAVAHGKVDQRTTRKVQQWLGKRPALGFGDAVKAVLVHRRVHVLREVGFELRRGHGDAVQEQHQVDHVIVPGAALAHHAQAVGGVAGLQIRVHGQRGLELRQLERALEPQQVDAHSQHFERAPVVQRLAQAVQQHGRGRCAVVLDQRLPGLRLRGLHPGQQVGGVQGAGGVVAAGVALGAWFTIEPALRCQVVADVGLERDFVVQAHGLQVPSDAVCLMGTP